MAGFGSELIPNYFADNIKLLNLAGIAKDHIHVLTPGSGKSILHNAKKLIQKFTEIFEKDHRQLVIIAHSKGASEVLAAAFISHDLFDGAVFKIYSVQGAFAGSYLADYVRGESASNDEGSSKMRLCLSLLGDASKVLYPVFREGIKSLTHSMSAKLWSELLVANGALPQQISNKIFYVTSYYDNFTVPGPLDCTHSYISTYFGLNDGILALADQQLVGVGSWLGTVHGDHADFVTAKPFTYLPPSSRYALTYALLKLL